MWLIMRTDEKNADFIFLFLLILIVAGLPLGIMAYDQYLQPKNILSSAKEFTLTGHAQKGWILGEVQAYDIMSLFKKDEANTAPVLHVSKGDGVVLKLRSSDVTHGFSMKGYGIYISKGINPGETVYVKFKADKTGTFVFSCNVFCGDVHHMMHGTLIVDE